MSPLRNYHNSGGQVNCTIWWKLVDLEEELRLAAGQGGGHPGHPSAASSTTDGGELLTPLSAGSGSFHANGGSPAVSPHEWGSVPNSSTGYNPYFSNGSQTAGIQGPGTPADGMYTAAHGHVMS